MPARLRLALLLALARAALMWERLWPRLWPAASIVGAFIAVACLDVLPRLPAWLHALVLALFALTLAVALWHAWPALARVDLPSARRRLERDSGLADRPLAACEDRLASGVADPMAEALWLRHREQMAARLGRLRVRWPRPGVARIEPWGIRAGVVLLLAVGLAAGRHDPLDRIARALEPGLGFADGPPPTVEVWISPPAYTRAAPRFLSSDRRAGDAATASAVVVPEGSTVLARVTGVGRAPQLLLGGERFSFTALDDKSQGKPQGRRAFSVQATVAQGERLAVLAGRRTLAQWPLRVIGDRPPNVALTAPPAKSGNGLLSLAYAATDDYAVRALAAVIHRADDPAGEQGEIRLDLPLAAADPAHVSGESRQDLSAHRWAGQPVTVKLVARDDRGQTGETAAAAFVLPERQFTHPVARAIVAARKHLDSDDVATRRGVAAAVSAIAAEPAAFNGDVVVSLALAVARSRLLIDTQPDAVDSVRDLLWQTALRLDEGEVPAAERALAEAQRTLQEAIDRDAPLAEIEPLMDALQAALQHYFDAVAAEMARRGEPSPTAFDPGTLPMASADLAQMLETARRMMQAGARQGAERLLAELQRTLDQLRAALPMSGLSQQMAKAKALIEALGALKGRQQSALDETFQRLRAQQDRRSGAMRGQPNGAAQGAGGAETQERLRHELDELTAQARRLLGSAPAPFSEADRAMGAAGGALGQSRLGEGARFQGQAVDALGRALDALGQALAQALGSGNMILLGPGAMPGTAGSDPFGRQLSGGQRGAATGDVPIPDAASLRRAEEILRELRRRAGEPDRPEVERDYIERMLRRF